jgi:hypothetical protein
MAKMPLSLSWKWRGMYIDYLPLLIVPRDRVNYNEQKRKPKNSISTHRASELMESRE